MWFWTIASLISLAAASEWQLERFCDSGHGHIVQNICFLVVPYKYTNRGRIPAGSNLGIHNDACGNFVSNYYKPMLARTAPGEHIANYIRHHLGPLSDQYRPALLRAGVVRKDLVYGSYSMKYGILIDVYGSGKNAVADAAGDKPSPSGFVCAYNVIEGKNLDDLFTTTTTRKPTTTTTTLSPQVLIQKNIVPLAKPFYRTYSYPHIRHAYHHNWEYLKKLVARGYKYENVAGKVIPYADYKSNKNTIDRLCPDLAVFHENFETFGLGDQLYHNQFYSKTKYTNANHRSNGETLVAATTPGYCGATVPVYYIISKNGLAFGRDSFYTNDKNEYTNVYTSNTFYKTGAGHGVLFYAWE